MSETRVKVQSIVEHQFPSYLIEEDPLLVDFIKQYYISQEYQGSASDIIQNIDKYIKLNKIFDKFDSTILLEDISINETTISVKNPTFTDGFPDRYGLIKIDDEIITYTSKTKTSFLGCVRGFSGVTSYSKPNEPEELVFSSSSKSKHSKNAIVYNLSGLFLNEFLNKIKQQFIPGFSGREYSLTPELDQNIFIKQSKDFYTSKGTDEAFKILFKALYAEKVDVIKPREYLFKPSDAGWRRTKDLVVESISGNPLNLLNNTLYQDAYPNYDITNSYASITDVERIWVGGKEYFKLSFDADYNKDLILDGTIYGDFSVHPKTLLITPVGTGATTLDVDSTVGFPTTGELFVNYSAGTTGILTYSSKSVTQFFGVIDGVESGIGTASEIRLNVDAYGYDGISTSNPIKIRIGSVLDDVVIPDKTYLFSKNDTAKIKTLGISSFTIRTDNWIDNVANTYLLESVVLIDSSNWSYDITTFDIHNFRIGDPVTFVDTGLNETDSVVSDVLSKYSFTIKGQGELVPGNAYQIKRRILKIDSTEYPYLLGDNANVQNTYTNYNNEILVASPSLPYYYDQVINPYSKRVVINGTFNGNVLKITSGDQDHGFYTGDQIYYKPSVTYIRYTDDFIQAVYNKFSELEEGSYYVRRVDANSINIAKSLPNISTGDYISVSGTVKDNVIESYDFANKFIKSQNIVREIKDPINKSGNYETDPGFTGILVNGVEILNYKSVDTIFYGGIEDIEVTAAGSNYDVINPPALEVVDAIGTGATGICAVNGSLERIEILDPGFDYLDKPFITITGGNGKDASVQVNMSTVDHYAYFNSEHESEDPDVNIGVVGIGSTTTIGFSTYHKFRDYEKVVYITDKQKGLTGLTTDAFYYVSVLNGNSINLHNKESDAISQINPIFITNYGEGVQRFKASEKKDIVTDIIVDNSGSNYQNKKRTCTNAGINTALSLINIFSHGYETGETLEYSTTGLVVSGLNTTSQYLVKKIDQNSFKLSSVGLGTTARTRYLDSEQYIDLRSIGSEIHSFNYPPISVSITGNIGVSTLAGQDFSAQLQPLFRGHIDSFHVVGGGSSYGSPDIINYDRQPLFEFNSGSGAEVTVVVNGGIIQEVLITRPGSGYNSPPDLTINGTGKNAKLASIVENGELKEIKVLSGGFGYSDGQSPTTLTITAAGKEALLKANMQKWTVNLFQKYFNIIREDDGIVALPKRYDNGLQYSHLYAPRKLRQSVYVKVQGGKELELDELVQYGVEDLRLENNEESVSEYHSPIIGWAYDGNPIYGPTGYTTPEGGSAKGMKSGYEPVVKEGRPGLQYFPQGFFNEDYEFKGTGDLDEHNGRFGITPEYPNGVYAYFATVSTGNNDGSGPFKGFKRPAFPYVIGPSFHSQLNKFNVTSESNQDNYNLNDSGWFRNTLNYRLDSGHSSYDYVFNPNKIRKHVVNIDYASTGSIQSIGILTGGSNYNVNDRIKFDNGGSGGGNAAAKVGEVYGKNVNTVSTATTSFSLVEFSPFDSIGGVIGYTTSPHGLKNLEIISVSGLSSYSSDINGFYTLGIKTDNFRTTLGIQTVGVTGLTTYFYTAGLLQFPYIRANDILGIGVTAGIGSQEKVKVLNIEPDVGRIRVLREYDSTVSSAYSASSILFEDPRKFTINTGFRTSYSYSLNNEFYFEPSESVGIGTSAILGVGSTITFALSGIGVSQIFVPYQSIYIPNHNLKTGEKITYSSNGGSEIVVYNGIGTFPLSQTQDLYVANRGVDFIGVATVKVGLGTTGSFVGVGTTTTQTILFFDAIGSGSYHSFKTKRTSITGEISKNIVTVSTASTHGLLEGDDIKLTSLPKNEQTVIVEYDDSNRRAIFGLKTFTASDVNTTDDTIYILNHGLEHGDKVIYRELTTFAPTGGLVNEEMYYILPYTKDKVRLCKTRHDLNLQIPQYIDITSTYNGELLLINPQIDTYRNRTLKFDLSSRSLSSLNGATLYSAFILNFYKDPEFKYKFESTVTSDNFEVVRSGIPGIDADAHVSLLLNKSFSHQLYYKLENTNIDFISNVKKEIVIDDDVFNFNQVHLIPSKYSGLHRLTGIGTTSFTFNLEGYPEVDSYTTNGEDSSKDTSNLYYTTKSSNAFGAVAKIDIINGGNNYNSIPGVSTLTSAYGKGAIFDINTTTIGNIVKNTIESIGFEYPTDFTLNPSLNVPEILKIEPLTSFKSIRLSYAGKDYLTSPGLVVIDGYTKKRITDVDLRYHMRSPVIEIRKNTTGMYDTTPTIIPINNSNGIGINTISYNTTTKKVTVGFSTGFSDVFPFEVGDKVLVENLSVGIGSTAKGFNSDGYDYTLFPVSAVDPDLGGNTGSLTYDMKEVLAPNAFPGSYDPYTSMGRILPEKYFPDFDIELKKNDFFLGESVICDEQEGIVESWNNRDEYLKVSTGSDLKLGSILTGQSSNTRGVIRKKIEFNSYIKLGPYSDVDKGWKYDTGILNNTTQRLPDNNYYQYFSYALKSRVDYDTWNDPVSSLNHTSGFVKFSNLMIESPLDNNNGQPLHYDLEAWDSLSDVVVELSGMGDLNCVYAFDLATEKTELFGTSLISNEIVFQNRVLSDYYESVGNRVLLIDDFSGSFSHLPRADRFSTVDLFELASARTKKYITFARDKRYIAERQILIVSLLHDNELGYLNQYGRVSTYPDLGSFDFGISGTVGQLNFYPIKYSVNDYDIAYVSHDLKSNVSGIGSTTLGTTVDIRSNQVTIPSGSSSAVTIVGIATTYRAAKVLVEIGGTDGSYYEFDELNILHDGVNADLVEYGQLTDNNQSSFGIAGLGTYYAYVDGTHFKVDFKPDSAVGVAHTINTLAISLASADSGLTGIGTQQLNTCIFDSGYASITASGSPGVTSITSYSGGHSCAYYITCVEDTTNNKYEMSEVVVVDDGTTASITEYGILQSHSSLGTFDANYTESGTFLTFTPEASINVQVRVFENAVGLLKESLLADNLIGIGTTSYNAAFVTDYGQYEGTDKSIKRSFDLTHNQNMIFQRYFEGDDSEIVSTTNNTITIPDHFFVTGEEVSYHHAGAGTTQALGIGLTSFVGIGTTDKLPSTVYIVKVNESVVKVAASATDALSASASVLDITSVGIGTSHVFVAKNQNAKALIAIDNWMQSPIVGSSVTTSLAKEATITDNRLTFSGITSFFGGNIIQVNDEIMKINTVGFGSTNVILVDRVWMGTGIATHSTGSVVRIIEGNYNIIDNTIHFAEAPYGPDPISSTTNAPDDRDWTGITTHSSFQGRTFMRSGGTNQEVPAYSTNYIFDDISNEFSGIGKTFTLKSNRENITGVSTNNAVILINGVFQIPQGIQAQEKDYTLTEDVGISSIVFTGTASSVAYDTNNATVPTGGVIVSVGSTGGFGYQPLVAAGGTVTVSTAGTIQSISVGNSGSGYRVGVQPTVNVAIQTSSLYQANYTNVGTATISGGNITGIAITSGQIFYVPRSISNVGYSSVSGMATVTTTLAHGLERGEQVLLSGIAMTCDYAAPLSISTAAYTSTTGIMTVTTSGVHGLSTTGKSSVVVFTGLAMTCGLDAGVSTHFYPRGEDPAYNTSIGITSDGTPYTATNAAYAPTTGVLTLTIGSHGFNNNDKIRLVNDSVTFTCATDLNRTHHTYPRKTDPSNGKWLKVSNVTTNTFDVNVGISTDTSSHTFVSSSTDGVIHMNDTISVNVGVAGPGDQFAHSFVSADSDAVISGGNYAHSFISATSGAVISGGDYTHSFVSAVGGGVTVTGVGTTTPTSATYDPSTGNLVLTIPSHSYNTTQSIGIDTGALTFSCSQDRNATDHSYPRTSDPIVGLGTTAIIATTRNTITVNIGASPKVSFDVSNAVYTPSTGDLALTIGSHTLKGSTSHTLTTCSYTPTTGIMTCFVSGVGIGTSVFANGDRVKFATDSLTFTCAKDSHATNHKYPRSGDYAHNKWLPISGVTTNSFEVQVLDTIPSTNVGVHTFVSSAIGSLIKAGESVKIANDSLTFTCAMDGYASYHTYPRSTDPYYDTSVSIGATTATTITLNVGITTIVNYGISTATYNPATGDLVLGIGTHNLTKGSNIKLADESLIFTCAKDSHASHHRYPRKADPTYGGTNVTAVNSTTEFEVNVGVSTVPTYYNSGGTVQAVIVAPRINNNSSTKVDPAVNPTIISRVVNDNTFELNVGISTRTHFYARSGSVKKPLRVVVDDPLSYSDLPLLYSSSSGIGTQAKVDVVVGQGSSVIEFSIKNTGYSYGQGEILTVEVGGNSGIPTDTSKSFEEFQITIQETFNDSFAGWSLGLFEVLDSFHQFFDGVRKKFALRLNDQYVTIRAAKGSPIDIKATLLIFINDIIQKPGESYIFEGGSVVEFTEAPKNGDTVKVIFYKGSGDVDVIFKDILETIKVGDEVTLNYEGGFGQGPGLQQDSRVVTGINTTDSIQTNPYAGAGLTQDETLKRPLKWCRQTRDKIINGNVVGKSRNIYEPNIYPTTHIIQSVGIGSTQVYVDSIKPGFDPYNEASTSVLRDDIQQNINISGQESLVSAAATANVSTAGTITSITITDGGYGYTTAPTVTIGSPVGLGTTPGDNQAYASATLSSGVVSAITIGSTPGSGYTSTNPPVVLIPEPVKVKEKNTSNYYTGDAGIVVGFGTTTVSTNEKMIFDLFIPGNSDLRNSTYVGSAITISSLDVGDFFVISNSNAGIAATSISSKDTSGNVIGVGTQYIDNVYQVDTATSMAANVTGVGITYVRRIYARSSANNPSTSGVETSRYFGSFSWGRIDLGTDAAQAFNAYTTNGLGGISTSAIVQRAKPLRYINYTS